MQDQTKDERILPSLMLKAPVEGPVLEDDVSKPRTLLCLLLANCGCPSRQEEEAQVTIKGGSLPPLYAVPSFETREVERLTFRNSNNQHM